ncbi:MAG: CoA-binding protein [Chloroflexales bacterium]|nr:CoA-binding protein [Chloroflexales bacterium]
MLQAIFAPRSVAVIGASPDPTRLGHTVLKNIVEHGYRESVFPIHPRVAEILGRRAYPNVLAVPEPIDLAVIVIPPQHVLSVVDECGQKGVKGLVVITAGFKEVGGEGKELERQLVNKVRAYGMRMIGPNSLGLIDTYSCLNASFAGLMPDRGNIALMSQSGAICTAILDWSKSQGIGFSRFVSLGNKADVDEVVLLHAWNRDPQSKVILAYLEDISDGPAFIAAAREVTRNTPVVAIKSGTTTAGSLAAAAHTGSLAGSENAYESAFAQSGILRARTVSELFDLAMLFASQPMIQGNRVAIVTNSGGMGIIAADAVEHGSLNMASFSPATIERLHQLLPSSANVYNPVDVLGDAHSDRYRAAIGAALADPDVDGLIVLLTPQAQSDLVATAEAIAEVAALYPKPVVTSFMGGYSLGAALEMLQHHGIPNYTFPERAVQSLAAMSRHYQRTRQPAAVYRSYQVNIAQVRAILDEARSAGRIELSEGEVRLVLAAYGLRVPESRLARSPEEAVQLAAELGYPVVMKISSSDILLKSEIGAVKVGVADADAARDSFELIDYRAHKYWPGARIRGVLVQELVRPGREFLIAVSRDPQFGPLVALGLSGVYVEVFKDVAFRIAPISEQEVQEQIRSLRAYPLLRGAGGDAPSDIAAIEDTVLRVGQLVIDFPEIVEIDINPLVAYGPGEGTVVLDARIIVQ